MKRLITFLIGTCILFSLTACGNNGGTDTESSSQPGLTESSTESSQSEESQTSTESSQSEESQAQEAASSATDTNSLVVYFSATGNTRTVAENLAEIQGADIHEIVPEQPYTDEDLNYNNSSTRATVEQNDETARPAILAGIDNIEDYDVIYVGFPIWWGDMPRILYTFFDTYDLSGKTIVPFCTSGGSGISRAVQSIGELEPSAAITDGLHTSSSNASNELTEWLSEIGLSE